MQVVIDIPDMIYEDITKYGICYDEWVEDIKDAIKVGTVLPKGHGRLIDAERLQEVEDER